MIKRFIHYYKPHRKLFALDMLCALFISFCDLWYPMISRNILNVYIPDRNLRLILVWIAALAVIYTIKAALNYFVLYYGHVIGVRMQAKMRSDVFSHLQRLPYSYFDEHKTGSIMSRIINDLTDISELAHHGPEDLFISTVMIIGSFAILCTIDVTLTLLIFALIPFLVWFMVKKRKKMGKAFTVARKEIAGVNAGLENSISGIRVAKAFTNKNHELEKFQVFNHSYQNAREVSYLAMAEFYTGTHFIIDLMNLFMLLTGALFIFYGKINFGDFVAFVLYVSMFFNPIRKLIQFVEVYENGVSGFRRFLEVMDTPVEEDNPTAVDLQDVKGSVDFAQVTFRYDNGAAVLHNIDLHIPAGSTVALVGPSGGGKTTLCHLIPRFYEVDEGSISIDGTDIRHLTRYSLRRNIGIVQQDVFIFGGSIYDNILYGRLDATPEEVYAAAQNANIHDYILTLPNGYDTEVGERGVKLSGGQKQRLSIARVFLKDPSILILDEATSALDNTTELQIQESLNRLCKGRTTLVVAHRLSTIKNADEIAVITPQGIEEQGTHQQLLDAEGLYAQLYQSQFKHLYE